MAKGNVAYRDYNGEISSVRVPAPNSTGATLDDNLVGWADLMTAIDAITTGVRASSSLTAQDGVQNAGTPGNQWSQRETKWLVRYNGNVSGNRYSMEIPTADLTLLATGSEFLDLSAGAGATFKTEFEEFVRAQMDDGVFEAVTVQSVQFVARNI